MSMLRNMAVSLLDKETIRTTLPKAKELRRFIEPIITKSRIDSVANRRWARARLANAVILNRLFKEVSPTFAERAGGYTRILKCGYRTGDKAPMAYIGFVDPVIASEPVEEEDSKSVS